METEFELTFLVKEIPKEVLAAKPKRIVDVYIPEMVEHAHLRLRQKGAKYYITKKVPVRAGDASEQVENTIELTKEEFEALAKCSKKRVVKDRYEVEISGRKAEVDVFLEELLGLVLVDFEFADAKEKEEFSGSLPEIVLADVTQEDFIAGGVLAGKKYVDIESDLARFGYKKILGWSI